jgi:membrane protein DedA with SNARE-associated domain
MLEKLFTPLRDWYLDTLTSGGYWLIALLMAIESSILPLPSEVVIPPAAYLAWTGKLPFSIGQTVIVPARGENGTDVDATTRWLSVGGVVIAGTIGSWLGATLMYWAARLAGRPLFMRYGKWVLITPEKIEGAERWADHYGSMGIFISRLLPVVRHLIGIPAGVVKMDYKLFSLFTVLGSGIWCAVLCYVGIMAGKDESLMKGELKSISLWLGGAVLVLGGLYYFAVHRQMQKRGE